MIFFFQLFCSFSAVSLVMYTLIVLYNCRVCEHNGMYHIFILPTNFNKIKKYIGVPTNFFKVFSGVFLIN